MLLSICSDPSQEAAASDTPYVTTDGKTTVAVIHTAIASGASSVKFSYRMPKGYWVTVVNLCDDDFNPFAVDFFAQGGRMFTETTPIGQWKEGA